VVRSNFDADKPGEFMVEVIGADGLKHHVGPFKFRADAEAWIAQNPSDSTPPEPLRGEKPTPRKSARTVE
jgi:hypothetical protein